MTEQPVLPSCYQSDHLFLLIGANPLPNYVAAKLLLKPEGRLYLVHSSLTQNVAERLERYWKENDKGSQLKRVPVSEADGVEIRRMIELELKGIRDGAIGLHYTGGTKAMSVHACRTLLDYQDRTGQPVTLSYLDARSSKLYIEYGKDAPFVSAPVLYEVQPAIETMVSLHAFNLISPVVRNAVLPDLASTLAEAHYSPDAGKAWRTWCDEVLRKKTRTKRASDWDRENLLAEVLLPLPDDELLSTAVANMKKIFGITDNLLPLGEASARAGFARARHLCEWLDGKWLEHHVYQLLCQINERQECRLHDIGMGICPKSESNMPEYEIDIAAMQGYRLYAISCTTDDDPGMCKLKLFEAYVRARNMAGDEAHVGLVCMVDKPENLERQVSRSWDAEGKVRVFGRRHLPNLPDHLADWFIGAVSL